MEEKDVLTYLKAKKQSRARRIALSVLIAILCLYVILKFQNMAFPFMDWIAAGAFITSILINSDFIGWDNVTKQELLLIIEKQVNSDPRALRVIAEREAADSDPAREDVAETDVAQEQPESRA